MNHLFNKLTDALSDKQTHEIIAEVYRHVDPARVVLASSLAAEDQVLTCEAVAIQASPRIFTLDTGRMFQEVYDTMEATMKTYGVAYEIYAPDAADLEALVAVEGPNCFYRNVQLRKLCCSIRKTAPLQRVLSTADVWICGLRRQQAVTRADVKVVEWDSAHSLVKINPLYNWSEEEVWNYITANGVPYCNLHDRGYRSIGCQPCTRAVDDRDDVRAGRWWWEAPEHKECGLHVNK